MNKTKITALLISFLLFPSCTADEVSDISETKAFETEAEPKETQTEMWIEIGSRSYTENTVSDFDTAGYFEGKQAANTVLALSEDMYYYDPEAFEAVSAELYRYILDHHGEEALNDPDSRVSLKDQWLKSLDPSLSYSQDPEIEKTISHITASSSDDYAIIAELDGVTYSFPGYDSSVTPYLAHTIIYHASKGIELLRNELEKIDPDRVVYNTSAPLSFVMDFTGSTVMRPDGSYSMGRYEDILSAAVMMMSENTDTKASWISEGLAEILGKARGYYFLAVYDRVFYLHPSTEETLRAYADAGETVGMFHISAMENFYGKGGEIIDDNIPEELSHISGYRYFFDGELYTHAAALANRMCEYYPRLSALYTTSSDGGDLSRIEAGSFVLYLMEQYDIADVLAVCRDYTKLEEVFGMGYDELEADWIGWLEGMFE